MDLIRLDKSDYGRYSPENKEWIDLNIGKVFEAERPGINYWVIGEYKVHLYDALNVSPKHKTKQE